MIDKISKKNCTGCNACYSICPNDAIEMKENYEGFLYPVVNDDKCNECSLCLKRCPTLNGFKNESNFKNPSIYAAWSNDEEIRINSTSGGIFSELAKNILDRGGCVVGARYKDDFTVGHDIIKSMDELNKIRQSKYVQSDIAHVYREIKILLEGNRQVLFCGTPCSNAALLSYLNKKYDNLLSCDFICRGVISPKVYKKYLAMLENRYASPINKVVFKNKTYGWNRFSTLVNFANGKRYIEDRYHDIYMRGYLKYNMYLRLSCHTCMFKELPRVADISLGDFWGIGKTHAYLDEDKGISVVFINSEKGKDIFKHIMPAIFHEKCTFDEVLHGNSCILTSVEPNPRRKDFFDDLEIMDFERVMKKYCTESPWLQGKKLFYRVGSKMKRILIKKC